MVEITPTMSREAIKTLGAQARVVTGSQRLSWNVLQRAVRDLDGEQTVEGVAAAEFFTRGEYLRFAQAVGLSAEDVTSALQRHGLL